MVLTRPPLPFALAEKTGLAPPLVLPIRFARPSSRSQYLKRAHERPSNSPEPLGTEKTMVQERLPFQEPKNMDYCCRPKDPVSDEDDSTSSSAFPSLSVGIMDIGNPRPVGLRIRLKDCVYENLSGLTGSPGSGRVSIFFVGETSV